MKNNKLSDLIIKTEHINGSNYNKLTIDYFDLENRNIKYEFRGVFDYKMLDFFNFLICEYEDEKHKTGPRVTIFTRLEQGHRAVSFPVLNKYPVVTKGLKKIKKLIIPYFNKYIVYSYEFGIVTSASYDEMSYDEESESFHVSCHKLTSYGYVTLFGTLDSEGHLIDNTLFIPDLGLELLVDEHNLDNSIEDKVPKIERDIAKNIRKQKVNEYATWENECYLKRKKGLEK